MEPTKTQILRGLETYFELTQENNEDGTLNENIEWDCGFQAAIAIVKGIEL